MLSGAQVIGSLLCGGIWLSAALGCCEGAQAQTSITPAAEAAEIAAGRYAADVLKFDEFMAGGELTGGDRNRIMELALSFLDIGKDPSAMEAGQRRNVVELDRHVDDPGWLAVTRETYWPRELASVKRQNVPQLTEELEIIERQPGIVAHDDRHVITASALDGVEASNRLVQGLAGLPASALLTPERRSALQAELPHMAPERAERLALGATRHARLVERIGADGAFNFLVKGRVSANVHAIEDVDAEARYLEDLAASR